MGVQYEPARKRYRASIQIHGKRYQKRFQSPVAADRWLEELERTHKAAVEQQIVENKFPNEQTLGWMVEKYIERKASRYKSYRETDYRTYRRIQDAHGHLNLDDIDAPYLTQHAYKRVNDDGITPPTVTKELIKIKQILEFAIAHFSWSPKCPWPIKPDVPPDERLHHEKMGLKDTEPVTPKDMRKIFNWMKTRNYHAALAVVLYYETGMRRTEVIRIQRQWIEDIPIPRIVVPAAEHKNKKEKRIILTPLARWAVKEAMKIPTLDGRLLHFTQSTDKSKGSTILRLYKQAATEILNRPFVTLHKLRRENSSLQRMNKIPNDIRKRQTGHMDDKVMDDRYTEFSDEHRYEYYQESFMKVDSL